MGGLGTPGGFLEGVSEVVGFCGGFLETHGGFLGEFWRILGNFCGGITVCRKFLEAQGRFPGDPIFFLGDFWRLQKVVWEVSGIRGRFLEAHGVLVWDFTGCSKFLETNRQFFGGMTVHRRFLEA